MLVIFEQTLLRAYCLKINLCYAKINMKKIHRMMTLTVFLISTFFMVSKPFIVYAYTLSENCLSNNYQDNGISMFLQGSGTKSILIMKLFTASYYKAKTNNFLNISTIPQHIKIKNFINVSKEKISDIIEQQFKISMNESEFNQFKSDLQLMNQCLVDLKSGDQMSITYLPNVGTKIFHNDCLIGIIPGQKFGTQFFNIWVGQKPFDRKLKDQILGENRSNLALLNQ